MPPPSTLLSILVCPQFSVLLGSIADIGVTESRQLSGLISPRSLVRTVRLLHECEQARQWANEALRGGPCAVNNAEKYTSPVRFFSSFETLLQLSLER
jgi:hypothetical protein